MKKLFLCLFFGVFGAKTQSLRAVQYNPPGTDNGKEYFEISGTPGASLDGLTFVYIDGDASSNPGQIKNFYTFPNGSVFGSNGLVLVRDNASVLSPAPSSGTTVIISDFTPDLQNGAGTFLIVSGFSEAVGTDLDSDNNGTLDTFPWTTVHSALSIQDKQNDLTDRLYAQSLGGTNILKGSVGNSIEPTGIMVQNGIPYAIISAAIGSENNVTRAWTSSSENATLVGLFLTPGNSNNPLPVTYTHFTAKALESSIALDWGTATETNSASFDIEKSTDALEFYTISSMLAQGSSLDLKTYSFIDQNPVLGQNYYRLKQIDQNGDFEHTKIISVDFTSNAAVFEILGNPITNSEITILLKNEPSEGLQLIDEKGSSVNFAIEKARENVFNLKPKTQLSSGIYFVKTGTRSLRLLVN